MSYKIDEIEGIGPKNAEKLSVVGIKTTDDLLELCCHKKGRTEISEKSGVGESTLLKWANMADLMRISGVGSEYSELLEAAGVDTVKELRNRNAENLTVKMEEVNQQKTLCRSAPNLANVEKWIAQAKEMDATISH